MAFIALVINIPDLPETFGRIFGGAFNAQSASGGFLGAMIIIAIRAGVARGLFSNEAGQGSTPIAHAVARTNDPAAQGRFAMMGTFIDTIVICTMTALVMLTVSGDFTATVDGAQVAVQHAWQSDLTGFGMTSGAFAAAFPFAVFGVPIGTLIASIALILFVFTTLLTWSYYGERAITYLYDQFPGSSLKGEKIAAHHLACIMVRGDLYRLLCSARADLASWRYFQCRNDTAQHHRADGTLGRGLCAGKGQSQRRHRSWPRDTT